MRLSKPVCAFLFTLLVLSKTISSQPVYFRHYQVEDGLSNSAVLCAVQDNHGFIWLGTKYGLNRFDGYTFKLYKKSQGDSSSLGSNLITALHVDAGGTLWVGTEKGLFLYNEKTDDFTFLKNSPVAETRNIVSQGAKLWFIAGFELLEYEPGINRIRSISELYKLESTTTVALDSRNTLWTGTLNGLIAKYDEQAHSFTRYHLFDHTDQLNSYQINKIFDDGQGNLLVGTVSQGLKKFDPEKGTYKNILSKSESNTELFIRNIERYSANKIWLATEDGIYIYETDTQTFTVLKKNYNNPYAITDNAVYALLKDSEGGMWAGTYFGGVNYYPSQHLVIGKFFPGLNKESLSGNAVREIVKDDAGNLWIGTEDAGLNKFDPSTKTFHNFSPTDGHSGISHTNIHGLAVIGNHLWIGTFENGLDIFDLKTEKVIKHYRASEKNGLRSNFIYSIYQSRSGKIFVATSNGLHYYNKEKDFFQLVNQMPPDNFYTNINETSDGTLWAGTFTGGVYFMNLHKNIFGRLKININGKDVLEQNHITYLREDEDKNFWIATEDGVYKIDSTRKSAQVLSTNSGLPSNMVYAVFPGKLKNIWMTTSKGLVRIDRDTHKIRVYSKSDGLLNDQFNYNSAFVDENNNFYLGSVKGLITFNPYNYQIKNTSPPVYITGFYLPEPAEGPSRTACASHDDNIVFRKHIRLSHQQSTFAIDFAALNYTSPQSIEYAFKMEGLDDEWNYIKNNQRIHFTNLAPGEYNFIVRSTDGNGLWLNNNRRVSISIMPPWWRSQAAYAVWILLFVSLLFFIYRFLHNRSVEKQKRRMEIFEMNKEKEAYRSKIEFFTNVAHEIKTPLTLIKGPMDKIMKSIDQMPHAAKNLMVMSRNTDRLFELTNELLDFRKIEAGNLSLSFSEIDLSKIIRSILANFQPAIEQKKLKIETGNLPRVFIMDANEEAITKIVTNLTSNAVKYCATTLKIDISSDGEKMALRYSTDGMLVPATHTDEIFKPFVRLHRQDNLAGTGLGLSFSRSLAELHNGTLNLKAEDGLNIFILELPIKHKHE